jgi:hypothetical protein
MGFAKGSTHPAIRSRQPVRAARRQITDFPVKFLLQKILIFRNSKSVYVSLPSPPDRGALANVIKVGRVAVAVESAR